MADESLHRSARAVLAFGVVAGLAYAATTVPLKPDQVGLASDVYYHAAVALLNGDDLYAVTPPDRPGYRFLYPPVIVLLFLPHAALGGETAAFVLQTALNLGVGLGTAAVLWRALARRGVRLKRSDRALLVAFVLFSTHGIPQVIMGQTTLWLGFALAIGFDALDRGRGEVAGIAFAAAALVKVFPAVVGLWLLRRRSWRAVVAALGTGLGGLLLGVITLGPERTRQYFVEVLLGRFEDRSVGATPDPWSTVASVHRHLVALTDLDPGLFTPIALVLLAPFLLVCYQRVDGDERRLAAILGTLVATLLVLPLHPLYFPLLTYPLVVLLYVLPVGRARTMLVVGTLFTYVLVGFETVVIALEVLPLPSAVDASLLGVAETVFVAILPATIGLWLLLVACVLVHRDGTATPRPVTSPAD